MKVAFVNQPFDEVVPPVQSGSLAIWTYQVAHRCTPHFDIVTYARQGAAQPRQEWFDGVEYRRIPVQVEEKALKAGKFLERLFGYPRRKQPLFASIPYYYGYIWQIANDLRTQQCDVVHIHNFSQFVPAIRAQNPTIKIVLHMNCEWLTQLDPGVIDRRLAQTDLIIGCSEYIANKICKRFPHHAAKCCVVFNGADLDPFTDAQDESATLASGQPKRILYVGRVSPEKGVHVLLDAFRVVASEYPNVQLDIVGHVASAPYEFMVLISDDQKMNGLSRFYDVPLRRSNYGVALRAQIPPDLAERVNFVGPVPHEQMIHYYRRADLVTIPSFTEAFPLTLVEAMASAKAVIVSRVGGMQEMVQENLTGCFVESGDAQELAIAIQRLLMDDSLRQAMGMAGRSHVIGRFTWDKIAHCLLETFNRHLL